jgi:hypothetical protein
MRFGKIVLLEALASSLLLKYASVQAFSQTSFRRNIARVSTEMGFALQHQQQYAFHTTTSSALQATASNDVIYSGDPSDRSKSIDARQSVRKSNFYRVSGEPVLMDDLLGEPETSGVSVVVFLRSLG